MLKAVIVKRDGEQAIYFQDNQNRTVSLEGCIRKVFTNEKDPLRLNLEKIIDLRNTSTHFITEEYEAVYVPLFQANIINFSAKINEFLNVDITDYIPENFLSLSVSFHAIDEGQIRGKYSDAVSARLLESAQKIANLCSVNGSRFAITVTHEHYITKKIGDTTNVMRIAKEGEDPLMIVQKKTDPTKTHPFTAQSLMDCLNDKLRRNSRFMENRQKSTSFTLRICANTLESKKTVNTASSTTFTRKTSTHIRSLRLTFYSKC